MNSLLPASLAAASVLLLAGATPAAAENETEPQNTDTFVVGAPTLYWVNGEWQEKSHDQWIPFLQKKPAPAAAPIETSHASDEPVAETIAVPQPPPEPPPVYEDDPSPLLGGGPPPPSNPPAEDDPHRIRAIRENQSRGIGIGQNNTGIGQPNVGIGQPNISPGPPTRFR